MATIEAYLTELVKEKNELVKILNGRGVAATTSETFSTLIPKVNNIKARWVTVLSNPITLTATKDNTWVSKVVANAVSGANTRATFSGTITNTAGRTMTITKRTDEISADGNFSGSGSINDSSNNFGFGFALSVGDGKVDFRAYVSGTGQVWIEDCGGYYDTGIVSCSSATITIEKIEQYY